MPKVSGSYQGVTMQPQFPTYQTAGMLRPTTPVTPPITQPPAPPPVVPPVTPPVITPPTTPTTGGPTTPPVITQPPIPPVEAVPQERVRLVNAMMRSRVEE